MKLPLAMIVSALLCFPFVANAIDCTPLDPRGKITKEAETKVVGGLSGLFKKIFSLEGEFKRKVKYAVDNLQDQFPRTESQVIKEKVIYLFCEALNKSKADQKINLLNSLQYTLELPITGVSEQFETKQVIIHATGIASISWQCNKKTEKKCPPNAELKRRAISVAQVTAAAALARQVETEIGSKLIVKYGRGEGEMKEQIKSVLRGIRYEPPVEQDDEISVRAQLSFKQYHR